PPRPAPPTPAPAPVCAAWPASSSSAATGPACPASPPTPGRSPSSTSTSRTCPACWPATPARSTAASTPWRLTDRSDGGHDEGRRRAGRRSEMLKTEAELLERLRTGRLIEGLDTATEAYVEGLKRTLIVSADTELISAPGDRRGGRGAR